MKRLALIAAAVVVGCGGTDSTSPTTVVNASATVVLSGSQTGTFNATNMAVVWGSSNNKGGYSLSIAQASGVPAITVAITFVGPPVVGHCKNTDATASAGLSVSPSSPIFWVATDANASSPQGSYDLNLTSVSEFGTVTTGKIYTAHGTLDSVMPAVTGSGATGTVTMHVTF